MLPLQGVMLEDSWVLGWLQSDDALVFELEASLWPGHACYQQPKTNEWACYKRAQLIFEGVTSVEGLLDQSVVKFTVDPDGSKDYGCIESLQQSNGCFKIEGNFGHVAIHATAVRLAIVSGREHRACYL